MIETVSKVSFCHAEFISATVVRMWRGVRSDTFGIGYIAN